MSTGDNSITDAPVPVVIEIPDGKRCGCGTDMAARCGWCGGYLEGLVDGARSFMAGLVDPENYKYCAFSCFYFLCCHAIVTLVLHICCCNFLKCVCDHLAPVEPKKGVQSFFTFFIKQLSNLWVTALLFLIVWSVLFRPFDVKPHLGASTVHEFELHHHHLQAAGQEQQYLSFNLTTYLLFKNTHSYYNIRYNRFALAVFYADEKLGPVEDELPSFKQKPHRSTVMRQVLVGRLRNVSSTVAETFAKERAQGRFEIVVRIRVELTYKFWPFKAEYFNVYDCLLSSPPAPAMQSPSAWCKNVKI